MSAQSRRHAHRPHTRATLGLSVLALTVMLAGCGILPERETVQLYAPQPTLAADPAWPCARWQLSLPRPHADAAHDAERILVRPRAGELQVYKGAVWAQSAPDLVHDLVFRAFSTSPCLAGVARRGEGVSADYELLLDLRAFEADYTRGGGDADTAGVAPHVIIEIGARLVHKRDSRIVASHVFAADIVAAGTGVADVNRAFEAGLQQTLPQIVGWTLAQGGR